VVLCGAPKQGGQRQEVTGRHVRVTVVELGATATGLASHDRPEVLEAMASNFR
jgi:hypothetical protein